MQRAVLLSLLLVAAGLAGCIGQDDETAPTGQSTGLPGQLETAIQFQDPQKAPHPAFGFPTMNDPARGLEANQLPAHWQPPTARELPEEIGSISPAANIGGETTGAGMALFGSLAVVTAWTAPTQIYDITEPTSPTHLATLEGTAARDADIIAYPDGRLVTVLATDSGVVPVWDITDPANPDLITELEPTAGSHNVGVVPGTPIVYNGNSAGGGDTGILPGQGTGITEIYDLSDPQNIEHVADWENGYGCHDITFFIDQDKQRAYCAGIEMTQIWDIADPRNPEVLVNVPVHHGQTGLPSLAAAPAMFSHLAMVDSDADVLIVGDETGGGISPGCDANVQAAGLQASGPLGNLWFYDLSDESSPQLMGWISASQHYADNNPADDEMPAGVPAGCTAHFGQIIDGRDQIAIAFYGAGVLVVDFTDLMNPQIVAQWTDNSNTWDVWTYQGYLFTGDLARGMDVLTLEAA